MYLIEELFYVNFFKGTNEQQLIDILASRSNTQRVEIRLRYKTMFGKVFDCLAFEIFYI